MITAILLIFILITVMMNLRMKREGGRRERVVDHPDERMIYE
jgi:hypothetical protein